MSKKAKMQYKNGYVIIKNVGNIIFIDAPSWRARRWAVKQLHEKAKALKIELYEFEKEYHVGYNEIDIVESKLIPALQKCNVIRSKRQIKRSISRHTERH